VRSGHDELTNLSEIVRDKEDVSKHVDSVLQEAQSKFKSFTGHMLAVTDQGILEAYDLVSLEADMNSIMKKLGDAIKEGKSAKALCYTSSALLI
jgi:hypothetical protein